MRRMSGWPIVLAGLLGCGAPARKISSPDRQVAVPAGQDLEARLARDRVTHTAFARTTLYTWTTSEQIAELRNTRQLLSRSESPVSGASFVDQVLHALAGDNSVAALLDTTAFARARFAWPTPWATRAGWPREQYGDQLIRVTLRPEAWIVRLTTPTGTFEVHDLQDRTVPIPTVLAAPHRIAAIYFVADATLAPAPPIPPPIASFREYVLCNESMIASWEIGTDRIAREVEDAAVTVDEIVRWVEAEHPAEQHEAAAAWRQPPTTDVARYQAALALASDNYALDAGLLTALAKQLRATPRTSPLEVVPAIRFAPGVARKPPHIVPRGDVSFARAVRTTAAYLNRP